MVFDPLVLAAAIQAMTPEERELMRVEQRRGFEIGQLMLDHPDMTREEAERHVDRATEAGGPPR